MTTSLQEYAFERFKTGDNIFITGPGGSGKTYLIKKMIQSMNADGIRYQVCAMTGCAAVLLGSGARTLHSWSGMGLATGTKDIIVRKMVHNKKSAGEMKKVRVLIVDEVSMMSKKIFEILDMALRTVRKIDAPFGGVQVIFTGDFFQLPPVGSGSDGDTSMFAFESPRWSLTFKMENHIVLKHIFRQDDDQYKEILNEIRWGELSESSIATLMKYVKRPLENVEIVPTKLFAVRYKTEFVNTRMYEKIEGDEHVYMVKKKTDLRTFVETGKVIEPIAISSCAVLSVKEKEYVVDGLIETRQIVPELRLKKGTRVMCMHNIAVDQGICNGAQGVVVDFTAPEMVPVVMFSNGKKMAIEPIWSQSEDYPCIGVAQIPLCLAWALTIHKIQGSTLTMAEMDLGDSVFEYGQTYVALSRIRSLDGLYLSAFQARKIRANPTVKEFYRSIPEISVPLGEERNVFAQFACSPVEEKDPNVKIVRL
jgi:ATP-dependent DNA helicase PIF1